jgi:ubiquinone/menaquinone biosynthesis C-methylase UbiE
MFAHLRRLIRFLIMTESDHIEANRKKWDKWAETADGKGLLFEYLRKAQSNVISIMDIREDKSFLDIGCGTGWAVGLAAKAAGYKGSFYGVDLSEAMIEKAKTNFKDNDNIHFIQCNSEAIPLNDNSFDYIICTNSFHHYLHPEKVMSEIFRLMKRGGEIYILDPAADNWLYKLVDKVIRVFESQHVKMYSSKEFEALMSAAGLKYSGYEIVTGNQKVQTGTRE